jgi:hypothetical protein
MNPWQPHSSFVQCPNALRTAPGLRSELHEGVTHPPACHALSADSGRCQVLYQGDRPVHSPPGRVGYVLLLQGDREAHYDEEGFRNGRIRPLTPP